MSSFHDDLSGFGSINSSPGLSPYASGQDVVLDQSGVVTSNGQTGNAGNAGQTIGFTPSPTLISGHGNNLAIDLIWDSSVAGAPIGFVGAVDAAAKLLVSLFHTATKTVLYIDVGWGEVAGASLDPLALGESASVLYTDDYADVAGALAAHGDNVSASGALASAPFIFTSAEAKALGLIDPTSGGVSAPDGAVGFSNLSGTGYSWQMGAIGTRSTQFNLQAVALHELTEVMGRISSEGTLFGLPFYTPLDLFDFNAPGALSLSPNGGYFSVNNGVTQMGQFNNAGVGDIGDWASFNSVTDSKTLPANLQDPFDAFLRPGYNLALSLDDLLVMDALGY